MVRLTFIVCVCLQTFSNIPRHNSLQICIFPGPRSNMCFAKQTYAKRCFFFAVCSCENQMHRRSKGVFCGNFWIIQHEKHFIPIAVKSRISGFWADPYQLRKWNSWPLQHQVRQNPRAAWETLFPSSEDPVTCLRNHGPPKKNLHQECMSRGGLRSRECSLTSGKNLSRALHLNANCLLRCKE